MLTQRLGSTTQKNPAFIDSLLHTIKDNPGCCDEVWLATDYGFPSLARHREAAQMLGEVAQKFRKQNIRVSLQLSNSIGHGRYMAARDCSGLVYEGSPVEKMVDADGTQADYCFCWNGKHLREYVLEELRAYVSRIQPDCVWVDDDLRATNHDPVNYGCFCPACMDAFNARYASHFTREELVKEINFGDKSWRRKHIEFIRDGIASFTYEMGLVIHQAAPNCRMGLQGCAHGGYTGYGYDFIYDAMRRATGFDPLSRPGGGAYTDYSPAAFMEKAELINYQNYMLPAYVTDTRPEIENLPDVVYGKSIGGTCLESTYYFANGSTSMSYAMLMEDYEPMAWHSEMFRAFVRHRAYWEALATLNRRSRQSGLIFALPKTAYMATCDRPFAYTQEYYNRALPLRFINIPVAFSHKTEGVFLLHPDSARCMSDEEIRYLLQKPVITDGATVHLLAQRGFNCGADARLFDVSALLERYEPHPVNGVNEGRIWKGQFCCAHDWTILPHDDTAQALGSYVRETADGYAPQNLMSSAIVTTGAGAKWAVFGFDFWSRTKSTEKRDQLINAIEYIGGERIPAKLETPLQAIVLPRENKQGQTVCVSIANCTVADSGALTLRIDRCAAQHFVFMSQYRPEQELTAQKVADGLYRLVIPNLKPWSVGTVFIR